MKKIKVEIWSDVVCPFCYIGKRKFEQALAQFPHPEAIEIEWKSFLLDPDKIPNTETDVYDNLALRYGKDRNWSIERHKSVSEQAKAVGLEYHFEKAYNTNTWKAHQLIQLAKSLGKGNEIEEELFKAYFTEGKNLNSNEVLAEIALKTGIPEEEVLNALENEQFYAAVRADVEEARQIGVQGVPFFVFDRKYAVSGAQDPQVFLETLIEVSGQE
jgi:predicted DsbA family dithiol-disulfide isomerase